MYQVETEYLNIRFRKSPISSGSTVLRLLGPDPVGSLFRIAPRPYQNLGRPQVASCVLRFNSALVDVSS